MIENEKVEETMLELEDKTEKTISVLEGEYAVIRAGRAQPARARPRRSGSVRAA